MPYTLKGDYARLTFKMTNSLLPIAWSNNCNGVVTAVLVEGALSAAAAAVDAILIKDTCDFLTKYIMLNYMS